MIAPSSIKTILNADQQAKFEQMMNRQGRGGLHGSHGQSAGSGQGMPSGPPSGGTAPPPADPQ